MAKKGKVLQTIIDISGEISPTLGKTLDGVVDKLEGVNTKAVIAGAGIAAIAGTTAAAFGKAAKYLGELGTEYDKAANQMAASTGLTGKELEGLEETMQAVYRNKYGESMQDAADGVAEVQRQTKLFGDELQATTEGAFALRDTFGYDIPETARAAKAMMENFGVSGEEAMGLIAAGAQNGLDYSGELVDSINEYSVQFAKLGFSADDMFSIFQKGADSGAWNLDKVGDAVKEFSIRSIDGSKTTIEAFEALGYEADDAMAVFAAGGDTASEAFQIILKDLMEMEDAVERDAIGVKLFGTQWEDLGLEAMSSLQNIEDGAYNANDALGKINDVKYNDLDSAMEGIKRTAEVSLLPAAQSVSQAFMDIAPKIEELIIKAEPVFTGIAEQIGPIIEKTIELGEKGFAFIGENIEWLVPVVGGLTAAFTAYKVITKGVAIVEGIKAAALAAGTTATWLSFAATTALGGAMAILTSPITWVVVAIGAVVAAGIALYRNWDTVKAKALELGAKLGEIWNTVSTAVSNFISGIGEKFPLFGAYLTGWWESIKAAVENVKGIFSGIIDFISNVFAGNWSGAWDNIVSIFGNIFGMIGNLAKAPINGVISVVNHAISAINGVGFKIPDWVPVVGGKAFNINIPNIPMLATGGFTEGPSIAGEAGTEAVISFDPAYRAQNLSYWAKAGRMLGADLADYSLGGSSGGNTTYMLDGVNFAPNITINGNADKQTIMEAIEAEYPEFIDMLENWLASRREAAYA